MTEPTRPTTLPASHSSAFSPASASAGRPGSAEPLSPGTDAAAGENVTLETATAQLTALRSQAIVATASGDVGTLRQLAARAAAIGVAAGRDAESLAGEIAAQATQAEQGRDTTAATERSSLGLDPATITGIFTTDGTAGEDAAADQPAIAGLTSSLQQLAGLNARATATIADARTLIATISASSHSDLAPDGGRGDQTLSLNGLAQLLDQVESQFSARLVAVTQQIGNPAPQSQPTRSGPATDPFPSLDLKT